MQDIKKHMAAVKNLAVLIIAIVAIATGCKKSSNYGTVDNTMMDIFFYSKGCYWVYRDSVTNDIDSFYVYENEAYAIAGNNNNIASRFSYVNMYTNNVKSGGGGFNYHANVIGYTYNFLNDSTWLNYPNYCFSYPFWTGHSTIGIDGNNSGPTDYYAYIGTIQPYSLNGNVFDSVTIVNHSDTGKTYSDDFYITLKAGIVKMRISHPPHLRVLELEQYNILR